MHAPEYEVFFVNEFNKTDYADQTFQWLFEDLTFSEHFVNEHEDSYYGSDKNNTNEEDTLFVMHLDNVVENATSDEKVIRKCFEKGSALVARTKQEGACVGYLVWNASEKGYGIEVISVGVQIDHRRKGLMNLMIQTLCKRYPQLMVLTLKSTPSAKKIYENSGWILMKDDRVEKLNESSKIHFMDYGLDHYSDIYQTILEENPTHQSIPMIENELFHQRLVERDPTWTDRWERIVKLTLGDLQYAEDFNHTSYYKPILPLSKLLNQPPTGLSIQLCQESAYKVVENLEAYHAQMKYYPLNLDEEGNLVKPFFFHLDVYQKSYLAICYNGEVLNHKENESPSNPHGYLHGSFENLIGLNTLADDFHFQSITTNNYAEESFIIILDRLPDYLFRLIPNVINKEKTFISLSDNPSSLISNLHQETCNEGSTQEERKENDTNEPNERARFLEKSEDTDTHSESDDKFNQSFI